MSEINSLLNVLHDISLNINNLKHEIVDYNIDYQLYAIDSKIYNINRKLINVFSINSQIENLKQRIQDKLNNN